MAQTSDRVSSLAADVLSRQLPEGCKPGEMTGNPEALFVSREYAAALLKDAKTLAASALRQDETPGLFRKMFRRG